MSTTTVSRTATAALAGGTLWALLPLAWAVADPKEDGEYGTLARVAVITSFWLVLVAAPALIALAVPGLWRTLGPGRLPAVGAVVSMTGLGAMALGNGIEVASMSVGGGEVAIGHAIFLIGFLVSVVGALLVGIAVLRRRRDGLSRAAGLLLTLALPLGIGIGLLGSVLDPENDAWFWAAVSVPTGIAYVLLGRSLATAHDAPAARYARVG